jgi:hypothetical protein
MRSFTVILLIIAVLSSCSDSAKNKKPYRPKSVGNINSLQVVVNDELWNNEVGAEIRKYYAAPTDGLPQDEPLFSINQMRPSTFSGFVKSNRIFLHITLGEENKVSIAKDPFARPQTGGIIAGKTESDLIGLIANSHERIIEAFHLSEIKERQRRTSKSLMRIDSLEQDFGVTLKIPSAYRVAKKTSEFYWIRKDLKSGSTNILVYEVPLSMIRDDSTAITDIITIRDSISGNYIPVEDEGRFITEPAYSPFLFHSTIDGKFAYETKGIWEVKDEYMAGPFLNYAVRDSINDRYLILEGFTYAPSVEKRNLQFELESILKSARIR